MSSDDAAPEPTPLSGRLDGLRRGLLDGLIDDAAVFPPGSATLADAVRDHRRLRCESDARYIGPLLVPAPWADALLELVPTADPDPLKVGVIGTSGDPAGLCHAVELLQNAPGVVVSHGEIAVGDGDPSDMVSALRPLSSRGLPLAVEVSRQSAAAHLGILADHDDLIAAGLLRAKFRTGGVEPGAVPSPGELAAVLAAAAAAGLPIKFTAGLHHAVVSSSQHGVLNVLAATRRALDGIGTAALAATLRRTDARGLATEVGRWTDDEITATRALFTSFGCCGVTEPLEEFAALGLIRDPHHRRSVPGAAMLTPAGRR